MADGEYSQKEENTFRESLKDSLKKQDEVLKNLESTLNKTYEQTLKTNGRVNKHDWYFSILWWGLGLIGSGIVFLLTEAIHKII